MAEQKKRGFHALEQRIHDIETEDAEREKAARPGERHSEAPRTEPAERSGAEKEKK